MLDTDLGEGAKISIRVGFGYGGNFHGVRELVLPVTVEGAIGLLNFCGITNYNGIHPLGA